MHNDNRTALYFKDYLSSEIGSLTAFKDDKLESEDDSNDTGEEIEMDRPKSGHVTNNYNGPYQPNYGNQYNIEHLTLAMSPPPGKISEI